MLIVALAAGLLTQFFPCCAFAIRSFSKVSATPELILTNILLTMIKRLMLTTATRATEKTTATNRFYSNKSSSSKPIPLPPLFFFYSSPSFSLLAAHLLDDNVNSIRGSSIKGFLSDVQQLCHLGYKLCCLLLCFTDFQGIGLLLIQQFSKGEKAKIIPSSLKDSYLNQILTLGVIFFFMGMVGLKLKLMCSGYQSKLLQSKLYSIACLSKQLPNR